MYASLFVEVLLLASTVFASHHDVFQKAAKHKQKRSLPPRSTPSPSGQQTTNFLTNKTEKFAVDGDNFPLVPFPIGESYAGEIPIANSSAESLFFWFFPSTNPLASNEIVLWLNGGPGCSSLDGLLQENGPFLWQSGTSVPNLNPYSWTNLTNMVWVDQPIGVGLSQGVPNLTDEVGVTTEFMGFWKNFFDTFDLHGRDVYLTGESYAGMYIPYIASGMLDANDTTYFNVKGIQINDPVLGDSNAQTTVPAVPMLNAFANVFNLNDTFMAEMNERADSCGFTSFMETALTFPPPVPLPSVPNGTTKGCDVWDDIIVAATYVNPCFNFYHILDFCPYLSDLLGFPSLAGGPNDFFNLSAVQKALHVPPTNYEVCGEVSVFGRHGDQSIPPAQSGTLAHVIELTNNVIVGNGNVDFLLPTNGSLIALQNMTWNGLQGFQSDPFADKLFVPYHFGPSPFAVAEENVQAPDFNVAGAGFLGTTHTERGLTFTTVDHAGHEIPQYVPGASYRHLEFLLGRISSLTEMGDFTTQTGNFTGNGRFFKERAVRRTAGKPRKIEKLANLR